MIFSVHLQNANRVKLMEINDKNTIKKTQIHESDTCSDRNPGCGITNGSEGRIIITSHLITIHLISTL